MAFFHQVQNLALESVPIPISTHLRLYHPSIHTVYQAPVLSQPKARPSPTVITPKASSVEVQISDSCLGYMGVNCLTCTYDCDNNAIHLESVSGQTQVVVDASLCHLCGACSVECPVSAIQIIHHSDR